MKHYAPGSFDMIDANGKEYILVVDRDEDVENPRYWDNLATIYCWYKHYSIGDDKPQGMSAQGMSAWDILAEMCEKYTDMEADDIGAASESDMISRLQDSNNVVIKYISCYEHSGITISTARTYPYNDRWDSSIIGFAFVDKETIDDECGVQDSVWKDKASEVIDHEVETLDQYLRGEVFCFTLEEKVHIHNEKKCPHCGEVLEVEDYDDYKEIESCGGFYGDEIESNGILDYLPQNISFVD